VTDDPNAFNLNFRFGGTDRLMNANVKVLVRESDGVLIAAVDRPVSLGMRSADFAVQWRRDGIPIPGEHGRAYTKRPEDAGHTIDCWVTDSLGLASEPIHV
jgi:hypothetical protein